MTQLSAPSPLSAIGLASVPPVAGPAGQPSQGAETGGDFASLLGGIMPAASPDGALAGAEIAAPDALLSAAASGKGGKPGGKSLPQLPLQASAMAELNSALARMALPEGEEAAPGDEPQSQAPAGDDALAALDALPEVPVLPFLPPLPGTATLQAESAASEAATRAAPLVRGTSMLALATARGPAASLQARAGANSIRTDAPATSALAETGAPLPQVALAPITLAAAGSEPGEPPQQAAISLAAAARPAEPIERLMRPARPVAGAAPTDAEPGKSPMTPSAKLSAAAAPAAAPASTSPAAIAASTDRALSDRPARSTARSAEAARDLAAQAPEAPSVLPAAATPLAAGNGAQLATPASAEGASAPQDLAVAAETPQDFATLVSRLAEAREAASPQLVRTALHHAQFGQVSLQFRHEDTGLAVTMASADPDFAASVQGAAIMALSAGAQTQGETARDGQGPQQQGQQHQQGSPAQGSAQGSNGTATGGERQQQAFSQMAGDERREGNSGRQGAGSGRAGTNDASNSDQATRAPRGGGIYA